MNLERIEAILRLLHRQPHVATLTVEGEGWRLRARKAPGAATLPAMPEPAETQAAAPELHTISAPLVGVFRALETPPRVGDYIPRGTVIGHIDAMGIRNPVAAEEGGYVVSAGVEDGEPVEYGQELFTLAAELPSGSAER